MAVYQTGKAFYDLYYSFTGYQHPEYPKNKTAIAQDLAAAIAKIDKEKDIGQLVIANDTGIYVYDDGKNHKFIASSQFRAGKNTGFFEVTSISHIDKPDYAANNESFPDICEKRFMRVHGYFELERQTHLSFYFKTACHIRCCLKAQVLTKAKQLNQDEQKKLSKVLSDRVNWLNMRMSEGAEISGGMKEVAYAQYAIGLLY